MEHVDLIPRERRSAGKREFHRHANGFAGPNEHRVLAAHIRGQPPAIVDFQRSDLVRTRLALEDLVMKAVQVHRVRHAVEVVADEPGLYRSSFYLDRRLAHRENTIVDPPAPLGET